MTTKLDRRIESTGVMLRATTLICAVAGVNVVRDQDESTFAIAGWSLGWLLATLTIWLVLLGIRSSRHRRAARA